MNIKLESILPFENILNDTESVFKLVDKNDNIVLIKDNIPTYIIMRFDKFKISNEVLSDIVLSGENKSHETFNPQMNKNLLLHEAMQLVLSEKSNYTMHAKELSDEIFIRQLYLKKNGTKAEPQQIRARCNNYSNIFEALSGNLIRLKKGIK